ncbi:hypothetical protein FRC12_010866 [Ceratobasidium sp. 428]|nr:hypothetical protein FRC12_010866 [Ceratobasidium sp. 428]
MQLQHDILTSTSNSTLSSDRVRRNLKLAIAEWRSARIILSNAVRSYFAACVTLQNACTTPVNHPDHKLSLALKDALTTVRSELEPLASQEEALRRMRISLAVVVNNLTTLSSINRLPPEVLAMIFELSKTHCARDTRCRMNGFADVCAYWRKTALSTANLWTHVDIHPKSPYKLIELQLRRSKDLPLHAHILGLDSETHTYQFGEIDVEYAAASMMMALQFHQDHICTLSIASDRDRGDLIHSILDRWTDHATDGLLRSLAIDWDTSWLDSRILALPGLGEASQSMEHWLCGLNTLHLRHVEFQWESSIYHGLIDLQLDFDRGYALIPLPKLASILSSCPALATLKLAYLQVDSSMEWNQSPTVMQHLEYVNLVQMEPEDVFPVLSLITLPGPRTELGLKDSPMDTLDSGLAGFFERSKVTTLYYTCRDCEGDCGGCPNGRSCESGSFKASKFFPRYLPHVHTLILHELMLTISKVDHMNTLAPPTPLRSQLQNLILLDCTVDLETLKRLVLEIGVQELHLERCITNRLLTRALQQQELQVIQSSLQEIYPHLRCRISRIDSTRKLSCRTIFNSD